MAELVVPELGESITEAVIGRWLKKVGESVQADEPVVDLETDKITVQLPAPASGALSEQRVAEGDTVRVGDVVGQIEVGAAGTEAEAAAEPAPKPAAEEPAPERPAEAEKEAPAEVAEVDVDDRGADGRLLSPSQRRAVRSGEAAPAPTPARPAEPTAIVPVEPAEREEVVKMSPLRKRIAERLVQAQHASASLTTFNEVDMSAVIALRKEHRDQFLAAHDVKLGFMSFFVKASVAALKLFPGLNAEVRGESIVYKHHYDLGIAVGTGKGLVVPVLRDCDRLGFAEIEKGINELAGKAQKSKLSLDDLMGGTFTITNGGVFGSMMSTPLLNYPQTGILGMHNIVKRAVVVGDSVEVRPMMYIAVTYDHRVVDGREAVQFLIAIKDRVERPDRLMFEI